MIFDEGELTPIPIKITPRHGLAGERGAIWNVAYGKGAAALIWDTFAARSLSNVDEIEMAIASEQTKREFQGLKFDRASTIRAIIARSGMFRVNTQEPTENPDLSIPEEILPKLREIAASTGESLQEVLIRLISATVE